jgi:hypothetical protein
MMSCCVPAVTGFHEFYRGEMGEGALADAFTTLELQEHLRVSSKGCGECT